MVLLHPCIPCQHGDHDACLIGQAAPAGMMGGWECSCKGECVDRKTSTIDVELAERATALPEGWPK